MSNYTANNIVPGFIEGNESFQPYRYKDDYAPSPQIEYSIGYGHQIAPGETFVEPISKAQASALLMQDLTPRIKYINKVLPTGLTNEQFTALLDLTMSMGPEAIPSRSIFTSVNTYVRNRDQISKDALIDKWKTYYTTAGGKPNNPGLLARRKKEIDLFFSVALPSEASPAPEYSLLQIILFIALIITLISLSIKIYKND